MDSLSTVSNRSDRLYIIVCSFFCVVLVLTNIVGVKLFEAPFNPSFALTTGIITYPLTFLATDLVSEIWGEQKANFMVILGFGMSFVMLGIIQVSLNVAPHSYWVAPENPYNYQSPAEYQTAFESVFSINGKLLFGSMLAYLVAQSIDVRLYHFFRKLTKGKYMWIRNNGSTWISQLVDTLIVGSIVFYWGFGWEFWQGIEVMATVYVYKLILAILDTPLIYLFVGMTKRYLEIGNKD
ncbi:MAG: putative integral membrane protein (TIGR00697 family) [Flammeovirgaceae bacterium]|jgi:uncharacterized integral membrane protein (TIGR00697 family)